MRSSIVLCSLLALVAVSQVAAFDAKVASAAEKLIKERDRVLAGFTKRLNDRATGPYDKATARFNDLRKKADDVVTALVKRVQDRGGNYAKCAEAENEAKKTATAAAEAALVKCTEEVKKAATELQDAANNAANEISSKVNFEECRPAPDATDREKSDALRCVDQRVNDWIRLIKTSESGWLRVLDTWSSMIVQAGLRCQAKTDKAVFATIRTLTVEVVKCERETARTTTTTPAPAPAP